MKALIYQIQGEKVVISSGSLKKLTFNLSLHEQANAARVEALKYIEEILGSSPVLVEVYDDFANTEVLRAIYVHEELEQPSFDDIVKGILLENIKRLPEILPQIIAGQSAQYITAIDETSTFVIRQESIDVIEEKEISKGVFKSTIMFKNRRALVVDTIAMTPVTFNVAMQPKCSNPNCSSCKCKRPKE